MFKIIALETCKSIGKSGRFVSKTNLVFTFPENIVRVFAKLPTHHKDDFDLALYALKKCPIEDRFQLFSHFSDRLKEYKIFKSLVAEVNPATILDCYKNKSIDIYNLKLAMFALSGVSFPSDSVLADLARINFVSSLFLDLPSDIKSNPAILKALKNGHIYEDSVIKSIIFDPNVQFSRELVIQLFRTASYDKDRSIFNVEFYANTLYAKLPDELKKDKHLAGLFIDASQNIRELYQLLPEELVIDRDLALRALKKRDFIFDLFPDALKQDIEVVICALKHCYAKDIAALYKQLPEAVKADEEIAALALSRLDETCLEELYTLFPESIRIIQKIHDLVMSNLHVIKTQKIPAMFTLLPANFKEDEETVTQFGRFYPADRVVDFYLTLPDKLKESLPIVDTMIQRCHYSKVAELYSAFPKIIQNHPAVAKDILEKINKTSVPGQVCKIYRLFPRKLQEDQMLAELAMRFCDTRHVKQLFELFPASIKSNITIATLASSKLIHEYNLTSFFELLPRGLKSDKSFATKLLENCERFEVEKLYSALPDSLKKDMDIIKIAVARACNTHKLYELFPKELRGDKSLATLALNNCNFVDIVQVYSALPDSLKKDRDLIKIAIERAYYTDSKEQLIWMFHAVTGELLSLDDFKIDVAGGRGNGHY